MSNTTLDTPNVVAGVYGIAGRVPGRLPAGYRVVPAPRAVRRTR